MLMWAICRPPSNRDARRHTGYTLIELLVVLALLALLTSLIGPSIYRAARAAELDAQRRTVIERIGFLAYEAYLKGQGTVIIGTGAKALAGQMPLEVPPGWSARIDKPIRIAFNGVCEGGRVILTDPEGGKTDIDLKAPRCQVPAELRQ